MRDTDTKLIFESYEDVRIKTIISKLVTEGKNESEVIQYLTEAGLWDRMKAKWNAYNPFDKESRENVTKVVKGKLGGLAQKGLKKAGEKLGIDPDAIEKSSAFKKSQEAELISGREGESAIRAAKLKEMLKSHVKDIEKIASKTISVKEQVRDGYMRLFDQIKEDLKKLNIGKSNIAKLDKKLNQLAIDLPDMIGTYYSDPNKVSNYVTNFVVDFFNQMKVGKNQGFQKAHKLPKA